MISSPCKTEREIEHQADSQLVRSLQNRAGQKQRQSHALPAALRHIAGWCVLAVLFVMLPAGVWGQSRMPANPDDYLFAAYRAANDYYGDYDKVTVIFFEVDSDYSDPLYFGIYDPGMDEDDNPVIPTPVFGDMWYRVFGGSGAYTDPSSRQLSYIDDVSAASSGGTMLYELAIPREQTGDYNNAWFYSPAISPGQGELVGNKRIFKFVVVAAKDPDEVDEFTRLDDDFYNTYQVAVSSSNIGSPSEIPDVRAFAYSLPVSLEGTVSNGTDWSIYPFIPEGTPINNYVRPHSFDGDYRAGNTNATTSGFAWTLERWDGTDYSLAGPVNVSGDGVNTPGPGATVGGGQHPDAQNGYQITTTDFTNYTWRFRMRGGGESGATEPNGADIWASIDAGIADLAIGDTINVGGGTPIRLYAAEYAPSQADSAIIIPSEDSILAEETLNLTLQIVDAEGNSVPYARNVRIEASGGDTPVINAASATEIITTDNNGLASFTLTSGEGSVTLNVYTDGNGGADNFGSGTGTGGVYEFVVDPEPTLSSALNITGTAGSVIDLPDIVISANNGTQITATNDLRIRIPATVDAIFDSSVDEPILTMSNGAGTVNAVVNYAADGGVDDKVVIIDVTADFAATAQLTISGLQLIAAGQSSGSLDLSFNGSSADTDFSVVDDKIITIQPQVYVWAGGGTEAWALDSNWEGGAAPVAGANVRIPNAAAPYPIATAGTLETGDLEIQSSASLRLNGAAGLTVNGTFVNSGILILRGDETLNLTLPVSSGTVEFNSAAGTYTSWAGLTEFYNLRVAGGTYSPTENIIVNGSFLQSEGTINAGATTWDIRRNWSRSDGTFNADTSIVQFIGTQSSTLANNTTFGTFRVNTPGKLMYFTAGTEQTMAALEITGSASSLVRLRSTGAAAYTLTPTTDTVNYADIQWSTVTGGATANFSVDGGNNGIAPDNWTFASSLRTWNGAGTDWETAANWTPNGVPAEGDYVIIPVRTNNPVLTADTADLQALTIESGAVLDAAGLALTVTGTITNNGTITGVSSWPNESINGTINSNNVNLAFSSPLVLTGNTTIDTGTGTVSFNAAATVNGAHSLTVNSTGAKSFASIIGEEAEKPTSFTVSGSGIATFSAASYTFSGNTTVISSPAVYSASTTISDPDSITFEDTVTIENGVVLTLETPIVDFQGTVSGQGSLALRPYSTPGALELNGAANIGQTGGLTLGNAADHTISVVGSGLSYTAATTTVAGTVQTSDQQMELGAVTLAVNSSLQTGGGPLSLGAVDGGFNFSIDTTGGIGTGAITFNGAIGSGTPVTDLSITSKSGVALPVITTQTIGNILVSAAGGDITDAGTLTIVGTSSFSTTAGNHSIILDSASSFGGAVSLNPNGIGSATLTNVNGALVLGESTVGGNLEVSSSGGMTQTGILSITGTSTITSTALTQDINLATQANVFGGDITVTGNGNVQDLSLRNDSGAAGMPTVPTGMRNVVLIWNNSGLSVPALTLTGSLEVDAGGAVFITGGIVAPDGFSSSGTSFDNTGGTITTTDNDIAISHSGAVTIGAALSSGSGVVDIDSSGSTVALNAPIDVSTGTVTIDSDGLTTVAAAGDITATGAASVSFGATLTGTVETAGDVVTAGGAVRYYRAVELTGNVLVDTTSGGGVATGANIQFDGAITRDGTARNLSL
ncbi:beta strand repeat-containing protein, partial [Spirochaeta dissipatitropha]